MFVGTRQRERSADPKTDASRFIPRPAAMFDGRNPYEVASPRGWHYLYAPLFAIAMAPLAPHFLRRNRLSFSTASVVFASGALFTKHVVFGIGDPVAKTEIEVINSTGPLDQLISFCATAALAFPIMNCLQRGQVGMLLICSLLLGARLVLTAQSRTGIILGGIVLALSVAELS